MTKKEFLNAITNGKVDIIQAFLDTLSRSNLDYCVIGGLAVNAYAEPVVSLDLDVVVAADNIETIIKAFEWGGIDLVAECLCFFFKEILFATISVSL